MYVFPELIHREWLSVPTCWRESIARCSVFGLMGAIFSPACMRRGWQVSAERAHLGDTLIAGRALVGVTSR